MSSRLQSASHATLRYRFRKSALQEALSATGTAGDIDVVLRILQDLELVYPVHGCDDGGAVSTVSSDVLYAVPGRLAHTEDHKDAATRLLEKKRAEAWRNVATGFHHVVGVRLRIHDSALMLPPSTFARLLQSSQHCRRV